MTNSVNNLEKDQPEPTFVNDNEVIERNKYSATEQPDPVHNEKPSCWELVIKDMHDRDEWGRSKYRTPLQPFNGRDALVDVYQELLDAAVYIRQKIEENKMKEAQ